MMFMARAEAQTGTPFWTNTYTAHDHTTTAVSASLNPQLAEAWADVKAPGDGFKYAVGTIGVLVTDSNQNPTFSGMTASIADTNPPTNIPPALTWTPQTTIYDKRQVVMLQCRDASETIMWQRYFYGFHGSVGEGPHTTATNARGVSVWPEWEHPEDTRIAICGETYDQQIPGFGGTWQNGYINNRPAHPAGFIAVFNGSGQLLWSHMFFGNGEHDCAITDVSIRRETVGGVDRDIITYCGISSHGASPAVVSGTSLDPVNWFAAPTILTGSAGGNTDNGVDQWDGIVGRIWRDHANTMGTQRAFHAIVGGWEQDGLFGIAEMKNNRFVVVGTTATTGTAGSAFFPFTVGFLDPSLASFYCVGATLIFDASPTWSNASLALEASTSIGHYDMDPAVKTAARDVVVQPGAVLDTGNDRIFLVGSTNDPSLDTSLMTTVDPGFQPTLAGGTDGFVLSASDLPASPATLLVQFDQFTYRGGPSNDGLTGISAWNEYSDHFAAVGFTRDPGPGATVNDLDVVSIYLDTANPNPTLQRIRGGQIGGGGDETPTAMGAIHAMNHGLFYDDFLLGSPAGGGISVDSRARVDVVGATTSDPASVIGYPLQDLALINPPPPSSVRQFLSWTGPGNSPQDAVHSVIDMVPLGVSRTDNTGTRLVSAGSFDANSWPPPATSTGGTTPVCATLHFGNRIGSAAPDLKRMMIDYVGLPPAVGVDVTLIVDRPPAGAGYSCSLLQIGYPASTPITWLIPGLDIWTGNSPVAIPGGGGAGGSWVCVLGTIQPGSATQFTAQVISLIGGVPFSCALQSTDGWAASPAMTFEF